MIYCIFYLVIYLNAKINNDTYIEKLNIKLSPNEFVSLLNDWLILWCLISFSTLFQLYHSTQCKYPCYVRDSFARTPHSILSEPLAAFSHSQRGNSGE